MLAHPAVAALVERTSFGSPPADSPLTCAVSGGPDSLALLVLAAAYAERSGLGAARVLAVHVDHGLRPGSAAEAEVVAAVAERLGTGFRAERVTVTPGPNLEARARQARYGVLPADACTGHTAEDRAETVLLHLLRGAGPTGAVGIARSPRRPLLDLRRAETVGLCRELGLVPVQDPSNTDPAFRRNRIRHEVLPLLAEISEREVVPVLVRQADLFAEVVDGLDAAVADLDVRSARAVAAAPPALARWAIRRWLLAEGVNGGYPVDAASVARVLEVAHHQQVATEVTGGWRVSRSAGRLSVAPPATWQDRTHG